MKILLRTFLLVACSALWVACAPRHKPLPTAGSEVPLLYARGFKIWYSDGGYEVLFRNPQDTTQVYGRLTLSRTATTARSGADTVHIPVQQAALGSTTFIAYFERIGAVGAVAGITYAELVQNKAMRALIDQNLVRDIANADGIDFEQVLAIQPDVFMAYLYGNADFDRYRSQGIPVVICSEYLESTPMARAEWVLLAGALTDRLEEARALLAQIESDYREALLLAAASPIKPTVFTGTRYGDSWFAPGNQSYIAQFIRDAGAIYAFEHVEGQGNVQLDFESVLTTIAFADYWGLLVSSKKPFALSHLLELEAAYGLLQSVKKSQVFVCNTAISDYFGDAVLEPHIILRDLVHLLHPQSLPNHRPVYFHPIVADISL
jgi:iron complex transport system substrate-binding protein